MFFYYLNEFMRVYGNPMPLECTFSYLVMTGKEPLIFVQYSLTFSVVLEHQWAWVDTRILLL